MKYREAREPDIPALARMRATDRETEENWNLRISGYWNRTHYPQQALATRVIYIAEDAGSIIGFIAGHLTTRFDCDGELQWVDVIPEYRGSGVASGLFQHLTAWFMDQKALRICVNCAPDNLIARNFYLRNGAADMNEYWLVWNDISDVWKG